MSPNRWRFAWIAGSAATLVLAASCHAEDRDVVFRASHAPAHSSPDVITVVEPADGQFIYSGEPQKVRPHARFAIGSTPRTDFVVFSAEEQVGLQALRDRLAASAAAPASNVASETPTRPLTRLNRPAVKRTSLKAACSSTKPDAALGGLAWPKVVRDNSKVCVPKLEFAEQGDWRDHLWCFDKGDGNVR